MGSTEWEWIFTSSREVIKLQDICVNKIIQDSLRSEIIRRRSTGDLQGLLRHPRVRVTLDLKFRSVQISWNEREKYTHELESESHSIKPISLSDKFQLKMQHRAEQMKRQIKRWLYAFIWNISDDDDRNFFILILNNFDEFVYDAFGDIDSTQTAKKMLEGKKFSQRDEFIIACIYCFEDEVKRLWPCVKSEEADFKAKFIDRTQDLLRYWVLRMTNQDIIEDWKMFMMIRTKSAMEYFQNRIYNGNTATDVRLPVISIRLCVDNANPEMLAAIARYWFPKFDDKFMESLVAVSGPVIIVKMMESTDTWKFVLPFWLHTKEMFSRDKFVDIFVKVFGKNENSEDYFCELWKREFRRGCGRLSYEIWSTASDELKNYALNQFQEKSVLDKFESLISS